MCTIVITIYSWFTECGSTALYDDMVITVLTVTEASIHC